MQNLLWFGIGFLVGFIIAGLSLSAKITIQENIIKKLEEEVTWYRSVVGNILKEVIGANGYHEGRGAA
jgi:SNF family Na+-dependent transporter